MSVSIRLEVFVLGVDVLSRIIFSALLLLFSSAVRAQAVESSTAETAPPKYPVEAFASYGNFSDPKLSPDGKRMTSRLYRDGKWQLLVHGLYRSGGGTKGYSLGDGELLWSRWAGNDIVLFGLRQTIKFYGEDVQTTRAYALNLATGKLDVVGKLKADFDGDNVIFVARDGSYVLLSTARSPWDWPQVSKVDLATFKIEIVQKSRWGVWQWDADADGVIRLGIGTSDLGRIKFYYRSKAGEDLKLVAKIDPNKVDVQFEDGWFSTGSDIGYIQTSTQSGRSAIYKYNWIEDKILEPVLENPKVDIESFYVDDAGKPVFATYADDRYRIHWFDDAQRVQQEQLEKAVGDKYAFVADKARDTEAKIVWVGSASNPGSYYFYDPAAGVMNRIVSVSDKLKGARLARVTYERYRARDGLEVPAYVTWPAGKAPSALPMIVMPHGGPHARDVWEYDYLAQFLANRGYLVVQPNFRGSSGFGKSYEEKGYGQWGRAMQDDIDDAARWLIDRKIADPKRVCMFGWSFGGYAAQVAAFRPGGIYRCAASVAGVSDLVSFDGSDRRRFDAKTYKRQKESVRGPDGKADIASVSSLKNIDKISIPLFLAHGSKDERVSVRQSRSLDDALTKAGKVHEYYEIKDGDHSLSEEKDRAFLLTKLEAFLTKYNPAD